jgi:hypothetical protein
MFEWDARKAVVNRTKHGVPFERRRPCSVIRMPSMARIWVIPRRSRASSDLAER